MGYLGNNPDAYQYTVEISRFNGTGACTQFTIPQDVDNAKDIEVLVNSVQQDPDNSYTVTGGIITFSEAPSVGTNNVIVLRRTGTTYTRTQIASGDILPNAVTTTAIADGSITAAKIADGTIVTADLADGAVTSAKIADATIATGDLADGAVTSAKIASGTVATANLADGAVTSAKIADGSILNVDIAATAAIATSKIDGLDAALSSKLDSATAASTYAPIASPTFTGTVSGITKSMVGLGNVENTALSTWAGSTNITTLGTIATGTWSGTCRPRVAAPRRRIL